MRSFLVLLAAVSALADSITVNLYDDSLCSGTPTPTSTPSNVAPCQPEEGMSGYDRMQITCLSNTQYTINYYANDDSQCVGSLAQLQLETGTCRDFVKVTCSVDSGTGSMG